MAQVLFSSFERPLYRAVPRVSWIMTRGKNAREFTREEKKFPVLIQLFNSARCENSKTKEEQKIFIFQLRSNFFFSVFQAWIGEHANNAKKMRRVGEKKEEEQTFQLHIENAKKFFPTFSSAPSVVSTFRE